MLYNRYVDIVLASTQRQVNSADAYHFVVSELHYSSATKISGTSCGFYGNYPTQTYEEATGQRETSSFRACGDAVDSLEFGAQLLNEG
ncbi:hypothetical protein GcM1_192004 [Golovinomyces cichoracearum]|uniref:Uncharacterized protein n=1 Tax=Golovinomyces cichoracearum TaxID=62708 RepID=A0A420J133_9PEZI|nr:hypothetical protein GcM1_192004 [Golovinomyces cichoracearum]